MEYCQDFEIICIDDCSSHFENENKFISELEKCSLLLLDKKIGRSKIRNLLAARQLTNGFYYS
jgi:hypothetical protein